jgi:hypothetical protein
VGLLEETFSVGVDNGGHLTHGAPDSLQVLRLHGQIFRLTRGADGLAKKVPDAFETGLVSLLDGDQVHHCTHPQLEF